ncbi:phage minor capsid protein [Enterococcus sp. AZ163]|uniref:phage minor capsid protein n=1 Tax=Enterococcus sp. AZ163 TaxID=2774638 RepID=UPI003D2E6B37
MITPHQLDLWSSNFAELYNSLEGEILRIMIKRLSSGHTDILEWQTDALKDLHLFNNEVIKELAKVTGVAESEINKMFEAAGKQTVTDIDKIMPYETKPMPSNLDNIIKSYADQSWSGIDNLVNQTLVTTNYGVGAATLAYQGVLRRTQALFNAGLLNFDKSLEKAIQELAQKGIRSAFIDKGGHSWSIERYVRTVLKSTLANTYDTLRKDRMAEYGVHTVIVTSHMGARPACSLIQGHVVDLRDSVPPGSEYKSIYDPYWKAEYGTPGGHRGVNCNHLHIPFIPGVNTNNQPSYDAKENAEVSKLMKKQRELERAIVKLKKNQMVAEAMGHTDNAAEWGRKVRAMQKRTRELVASNEYLSRNYKREKVYTPLNTLLKDFRYDDF